MTLTNLDKLPEEGIPVLQAHVGILTETLGDKLVGVYVHGSASMGGFDFMQSDLDYLAVVSTPLAPDERRRLADSFLKVYGKGAPAQGVEMSIVVEEFVGKGFRYPTPYEFHMGTTEQVKLHGRPHTREMLDADLAAHFTITKERGICVWGKAIDVVFADVPRRYYLASIALDSAESFRNIQEKSGNELCAVPGYGVLNFCRVLAFIDQDLIVSKLEGGEWSLTRLPQKYHSIILAALQETREADSSRKVAPADLKDFAVYAWGRISDEVSRRADR